MIPFLLANAIAADAGLIQGLAIFGPAMGVSVLAAFIERPFVKRAGFGKSAIWFSLQAKLGEPSRRVRCDVDRDPSGNEFQQPDWTFLAIPSGRNLDRD